MFSAGAAVLQRVAILDVAAVWQIRGEEAAEYGDHDACEDRVPRHIEYVTYVFTAEIRHNDVIHIEENIAAEIAEYNRYHK